MATPARSPGAPDAAAGPALVRGLGAWDGALVTAGSILGSALFLAAGEPARVLGHPGLVLLAWVVGGLLTVVGALTYAELGAMFPKAGGQYHVLKEVYGPVWGFLFGWACFTVVMCGGLAAIAVGFGEALGAFVPASSGANELFSTAVGGWRWRVSGAQLTGALALAALTAVNCVGLAPAARLQNVLTVAKVAAVLLLAVGGLLVQAPVRPAFLAPLPAASSLWHALGAGMIAVLWSYDGWYGLTYLAGEIRDPGRNLPRGLLGGVALVTTLYLLTNLAYLRALPVEELGGTVRVGEAAARTLFGPAAARAVAVAVLVSIFGCLAATVLYAARIYLPLAQDGLFFRTLAEVHPRYLTPARCLLAQGAWSAALALSGSYDQLYTYVIVPMFLFHVATGAALFVLRRRQPERERPYRVWGYPVVPALFVATALGFVANTVWERPAESLLGLGLVAAGLPAYALWRRGRAADA